ncbi:MAG: FAD binding domain-containing protein [Methyloligellaceae bacterium]
MKPVAFDYARPTSLDGVLEALDAAPGAKILAGGQTLGPMLNLRLVQPALLVDITRVAALAEVREQDDAVLIGACVTHASIEDGNVADPANGFLRRIARGIAYRAVRTRGTIGGSLAHADPAADWLSGFSALAAEVQIAGPDGARSVPLADFVQGVFETALAPNEVLKAIRIPKLGPEARCGFAKISRKTGEFAEAIGVAVVAPKAGLFRLVAGAGSARPILLDDPGKLLAGGDPLDAEGFDLDAAVAALAEAGLEGDPYELRIHAAAMKRALAEALA